MVFLTSRMNKCLERVNDRYFWNPGVFSYAMVPKCHPNSRVFFFSHRHIYSLWFNKRHQEPSTYHLPFGVFDKVFQVVPGQPLVEVPSLLLKGTRFFHFLLLRFWHDLVFNVFSIFLLYLLLQFLLGNYKAQSNFFFKKLVIANTLSFQHITDVNAWSKRRTQMKIQLRVK